MAMISLLNSATLDGWSTMLDITMYGCQQFSGGHPAAACDRSKVQPSPSPAHHIHLITAHHSSPQLTTARHSSSQLTTAQHSLAEKSQ